MKKGIILLGMLAVFSANAQETRPICGTSAADQDLYNQRLLDNLATVESGLLEDRGATQYVPIHMHLVANASGTGRGREVRCLEQLCALNAAYASIGIQFYLVPHPANGMFDKSISNDGVYTTQDNTILMQSKRHFNAINYYIVNEAASGNNDPGTVLAYYSPQDDWVVSRRDQITGAANNSTVAHETGHFFSLQHPFKGWESTSGFGPDYPGWPIAPVLAPDGGPTERQNGTNCAVAADKICDTPPDYKFAFQQSACAPYNGGAKDPLGELVDPMEINTMSYFDQCSLYQFTPLQSSAMLADLSNSDRNYLDNNFTPTVTSLDTPADLLVAPANGVVTQFYNSVILEWNAVPNATHYAIEIDKLASFISPNMVFSTTTTGTSIQVKNLSPNTTYYWRVKPFTNYVGCATPRSRMLKTSTVISGTVDIEGLESWQVSPNPVEGDQAHITLNAVSNFNANISIVDAAGHTVKLMPQVKFNEGASQVELPLEGLANGFYFIYLDNGQAHDVRKLVLAR